MVYKAGVEVHVDADTLVHLPFRRNNLGSQFFHQGVEGKFLLQPLFFGQFLHERLEGNGTGVGFGINCMSYTVYQTGVVESFFM